MKNRLVLTIISIVVTLSLLSGCSFSDDTGSSNSKVSSTGITELKFATLTSPLELKAEETKTGYFSVKGDDNFSMDDIEFISSDSSVVT